MTRSPAELLVTGTGMEAIRTVLVPGILPERCYDEFFLNYNLLHGISPRRPPPMVLPGCGEPTPAVWYIPHPPTMC